ncbi:MAG TPA: TIGR03013 family XrtA/PEP-CTERM system glycosyltransferase [Vicinamibacterales bacterium]|nr:TIGR03013 family XrtA/PEP-CTERM system glycosyltransferase [Vicinamibacterales bacterium]
MHRSALRTVALVLFETVAILLTVGVAAWIRFGSGAWDLFLFQHGVERTLIVAVVTQTCLYFADLYNLKHTSDRRQMFVGIIQSLAAASFILAAVYYWFPDAMIGRGIFAIALPLIVIISVVFSRILYELFNRTIGPRERLLLVGTNSAAVALAGELHNRRIELGVEIVGFVDADPARVGQPVINPGVIGTVADIPTIVGQRGVDRVVVSLVDARGKLPMDQLLRMKIDRNVTFDHLPSVYEEFTGKIAVDNLRPSWLLFSEGFKKTRLLLVAKRVLDLVCAAVGLTLLSPVMALVAAMVKLTSPGPVLYHQARVGKDGKLFTVHKFRSMRQDAEAKTGPVWAQASDPRITPIGGFLRRARLDELPQLWNVLLGDMSMVGPRPERPEFVAKLTEEIPFYGLRHTVRPGVTGWAQVSYTYGASVEDALEKLQYDLFYIKRMAVAFDLFVLFSTVKTVILRRGAQ